MREESEREEKREEKKTFSLAAIARVEMEESEFGCRALSNTGPFFAHVVGSSSSSFFLPGKILKAASVEVDRVLSLALVRRMRNQEKPIKGRIKDSKM